MNIQELENCWEFKNCDEETKTRCPAYTTNSGDQCWLIASSYQHDNHKSFMDCLACDWFKQKNINLQNSATDEGFSS